MSQLAGNKLMDRNSAITDLSDPNRPMRLGERFSEIYDNEWTDAFVKLTEVHEDEKARVQILLNTAQVLDLIKNCMYNIVHKTVLADQGGHIGNEYIRYIMFYHVESRLCPNC